MIIWLNGALMPIKSARIDPRDRGLLLGDGVFETMFARDGLPFRLSDHLVRLRRGAGLLGIPIAESNDSLRRVIAETVEANILRGSAAAIRLTLTRGIGQRGLLPPAAPQPTLMIVAEPAVTNQRPARAMVASPRRNQCSPLSRIKSLNYLDNVLARREAAERGADEALLLNTCGRLAEASAANLFLFESGKLVTPALDEGALPGVTRAVVMELALQAGIAAKEDAISVERLFRSDEAFLTNSLIGVRPLVGVDGRPLGDGMPGPLTRKLQSAYRAALAGEPKSSGRAP